MMENRAKFNDGQYHVLVFERSGENATLRVDNFPIHRLNPAGRGKFGSHLSDMFSSWKQSVTEVNAERVQCRRLS